jgi:hypothetical protein
MREEGVGDGGHVEFCEQSMVAHAFYEYFFVVGAEIVA